MYTYKFIESAEKVTYCFSYYGPFSLSQFHCACFKCSGALMDSLGKSNAPLADVMDVTVGADEGVAKNPVRAEAASLHVEQRHCTHSSSKLQLK